MSIKHFNHIILPWAVSHSRNGHPLADIPVASPKRRRPPVERIPEHGARLHGPPAQQRQAAAKRSAVVELAIGQDIRRGPTDGVVVVARPALLEADNVRRGVQEGQLAANLGEARRAQVGDEEEAPAVEREEADLRDGGVIGVAAALRG